jgi:Ca-activated chloride channel homolog
MPQQSPQIQILPFKTKFEQDVPQTIDVVVRIKSPKIQTDDQPKRPKLNLSLVIDRSGSMDGNKMREAIEAACFCIDELGENDFLSIVGFDHTAEILSPAQPVTHKQALKERVRELYSRGSTALHDGWITGGLEVAKFQDPLAVNRVLLITDGEANVGLTHHVTLGQQSGELNERGISTSTIGIGRDFNEDLLIKMADSGGGNTWHVVTPNDMRKIFETELNGLVAQFGHSARISIAPSPGVRSITCLNEFERNHDGSYSLPSLTSANDLDIAFRIQVDGIPGGSDISIADLRLEFTEQRTGERVTITEKVQVDFAKPADVAVTPVNPVARETITLIEAARERARVMNRIDRGDYQGAQHSMRMSLDRMRTMSKEHPSASMDDEIFSMEDELRDLAGMDLEMARKKLAFRRRNRDFGKFS